MKKNVNLKKIIIILTLLVFGIGFARQIVVLNGIKNEISVQTKQLEELKEKNVKLQAELERAQSNNDYLEKLARERMGLIKDGEQQVSPLEIQE